MNQKQLANVLTKMLGLSLCIHTVPSLFSQLVSIMPTSNHSGRTLEWQYVLATLVSIGLGIYVILSSRMIVEFLFRSEEE